MVYIRTLLSRNITSHRSQKSNSFQDRRPSSPAPIAFFSIRQSNHGLSHDSERCNPSLSWRTWHVFHGRVHQSGQLPQHPDIRLRPVQGLPKLDPQL